MTPGDRRILIGIIKQRERVAKADAARRSAEILVDFDAQLQREFSFDENEIWSQAVEKANAAVAEASRLIAEECKRLGIPDDFAPSLNLNWRHQGYYNGTKDARAKLRFAAVNRVQAAEKAAKAEIEKQSVTLQEKVLVGALESGEAQGFLASIPTVEQLMPIITIEQVKSLSQIAGGAQ
ncbi:hypothetical protein [Mesorhizobium sp. B2-4-6]|uniref:hypothetical protein n=1 Tax=Mesorhizobium sp. B2-4-6 TaxID=2589943 RepID=UPI0011263EE9|nr:hypothetical protein [Mesorhizobium sp. B2-4-6]TPL40640.1 hypothetical protein FJ957_25760 [Mesorhizobium sp. B2-4-6]